MQKTLLSVTDEEIVGAITLSFQHFVNVQKRNDGCCVILNPRYEDERSQKKETLRFTQCDDQEIHVIGSEAKSLS